MRRAAERASAAQAFSFLAVRRCSTPSASLPSSAPQSAASNPSSPPHPQPLFVIDRKTHGISEGVAVNNDTGSFSFFMKPESEKPKPAAPSPKPGDPLPCSVPGSEAQKFADTMTGPANSVPQRKKPLTPRSSLPPLPKQGSPVPKPIVKAENVMPSSATKPPAAAPGASAPNSKLSEPETPESVDSYYASIREVNTLPTKDDMWSKLNERRFQQEREKEGGWQPGDEQANDIDYLRMDEELKEAEYIRWRDSCYFFRDETIRRKWCSLWNLSIALNKTRWKILDAATDKAEKGPKSSEGTALRMMFWKDAIQEILEKGSMVRGQFVDGHPVLRPFAHTFQTTPGMTKTFIRNWTDARLRVMAQPANTKVLCEHFDKSYGCFYNSLLEVIGVKSDDAQHMMMHLGRAYGITMHCVMFWKKYAALNVTMLPADICADRYISMSLLRKTALANQDKALRSALEELMSIVKTEMIHAHDLHDKVPIQAYPVVWECIYPNYHLGFLQRFDFDINAMYGDHNLENPFYHWYAYKKIHQWRRKQSLGELLSEHAPLPYTNICIGHRGSVFKMPGEKSQTSLQNPSPNKKKVSN